MVVVVIKKQMKKERREITLTLALPVGRVNIASLTILAVSL